MPIRTIRQIPVDRTENALTHVVSGTRSFVVEEFFTACGLKLITGTRWSAPAYDMPTCVQCLGTPKQCVACKRQLAVVKFPRDVPERCGACAP